MSELSDSERLLCFIALVDIIQAVMQDDEDAMEALADDFWVAFISTLDEGRMSYALFMEEVASLRQEYRRGRGDGNDRLRLLRQTLAKSVSTSDRAGYWSDSYGRAV